MPINSQHFFRIAMRCALATFFLVACDKPEVVPPGGGPAPAPSGPGASTPPAASPGPGGSSTLAPAAGALPCDVERIIQQRCQACHQRPPQFGAPMPLLTWSDTQANAVSAPMPVRELMKTKVSSGMMPPPATPSGPLSAQEKATLMAWLEAGAPKGTSATCTPAPGAGAPPPAGEGGPPSPPVAAGLPCTPKYEFRASGATATEPFAVPQVSDTYRCFAFQVPFTPGEQAIAWAPIIDDKRVVHHWILYGHRTTLRPVGCGDTGRIFLMGWAPGGKNGIMPPDVGLELPDPGTWLTLEVHYNNKANFADARDRSGVTMCTTETARPKEAGTITLGSVGILIPAGAENHPVVSEVPGPSTQSLPETLHVLWTSPHMHTNGTSFRTDITRAGKTFPLVEVANWDFGNQQAFIRDPETTLIQPGDSLKTTCTYRNTTSAPIRFGEKTENEMCFNFIVAYPITRVPTRQWVTR